MGLFVELRVWGAGASAVASSFYLPFRPAHRPAFGQKKIFGPWPEWFEAKELAAACAQLFSVFVRADLMSE
jgi:hypothetical protein